MAKSSPVSALKAYWFPLILFASSMFYQLLILPRSYPPSHYDVLGIKRYSSMEQVTEAYEKFSSKWNSGTEVPPITEFIKIRYAFELLTNPLWKRNYDIFSIDEHIHVLDSIKERHAGTIFSEIDLPLLESASFDPGDHDFEVITSGNFLSKFENSKALLIQVFSFGSDRSAQFYNNWKKIELPQLRSVTSMELGCDARGYSRAGNETAIWYCVILAGRSSPELNKMRATVRRIQEALSTVDKDQPSSLAAVALKEKRLTFTWLDGEAQQRYCFFHTQMENSYETCGPRRDITDVPQLIIVRYKRNATEDSIKNEEKKPKNMLEAFLNDDVDPASQLVARYNGSEESSEIIKWISQIIEDGDSRELPFFGIGTCTVRIACVSGT
ncbi:hypothetical protein CsSME_00053587 [Camellia sinensis var. sinensis]